MLPEKINALAAAVEKARMEIIFENDGNGPVSNEHVLIALGLLEAARSHLKIAEYTSMRGD